jgi:hypothetical protein
MVARVSFIIIILTVFVGMKVSAKEEDDDSPIYTRYVAEVTSAFLKEMYKEYGFECGASGGSMPYDVEEILVKLVAYRSATIEQARELEVKATERFAQIINAHEKIRPFLREYPFPSGRVRVSISFRPSKKAFSLPSKNDVTYVLQAKNKLVYLAYDPDHPYVGKRIKDEPYEEALRIVQSNEAKKGSQKSKTI